MRIWSMISGTKLEAKDTCSLKGFYMLMALQFDKEC